MQVNINNPSTIYITFKTGTPRLFKLYRGNDLYYFRYTDGKIPRIKFNIPDKGTYESENNFEINKIVSIEIPDKLPLLPPAERDRLKPIEIKFNPDLKDGPVIIHTNTNPNRIETSKQFYNYPNPIKLFLLLHEAGHQFYKTEKYCDLYALVNYIRMGYNRSMGYYSMIKILRRSKENVDRIAEMLQTIKTKTGEAFNPGI